jgi:hypothetical protein
MSPKYSFPLVLGAGVAALVAAGHMLSRRLSIVGDE